MKTKYIPLLALNILLVFGLVFPAISGTFRDDFENEKDFLGDKKLREGGIWGEDITFYTWEKGSIKGSDPQGLGLLLIAGDYDYRDYTVECKVKPLKIGILIGLALRRPCIDCPTAYLFGFWTGNLAAIFNNFGGAILDSSPFEIKEGTWYLLKAVAKGEQLEFYVNNKLMAKAKDNIHPTGKAGFVVWNDSEALFDDFIMTGLEVKSGGHWNPKAHEQKSAEPQNKLTTVWSHIKRSK